MSDGGDAEEETDKLEAEARPLGGDGLSEVRRYQEIPVAEGAATSIGIQKYFRCITHKHVPC